MWWALLQRLAGTRALGQGHEDRIEVAPVRILLANALVRAGAAIRRTKPDSRVCAGLFSAVQSAMRPRLIAAAVRTCWRWVLAAPIWRLRRRPLVRTAFDSVPSMPARRFRSAMRAGSLAAVRAATRYSCSCRRRGARTCRFERVHRAMSGQALQLVRENRMRTLSWPQLVSGIQLSLVWPAGQVAIWRSQSRSNCSMAKAPSVLACH